jgi:hypothetical protein
MTLFWAATAGMHLARSDTWSPEMALHPITAVRPISTGEIIFAKLKVAALVTALGWVWFALLAFPVMQTARIYAHLNDDVLRFWANFPTEHATLVRWVSNPVVILTTLGLTWHAIVEGMCPVLAGQPRKNFWVVGRLMTFFGVAVLVAGWLYRHPGQMPAFLVLLPWITAAKLVWKWVTSARAFIGAYRGKIYSRTQWQRLLAIWMALTAGVSFSASLACAAHSIPTPIILFLAVWLLPGGQLPACAPNLAQNRHR